MSLPTPEEILRKCGAGTTVVVICRRPTMHPPPPPGAKRGYHCSLCNEELEATRAGQQAIANGGIPLCTICGVLIAEMAERKGRMGGVASTPEANASIERGTGPLGARIERLSRLYPWEKL